MTEGPVKSFLFFSIVDVRNNMRGTILDQEADVHRKPVKSRARTYIPPLNRIV